MPTDDNRVFVSSTFEELSDERDAVFAELDREGFEAWQPSLDGGEDGFPASGNLSHKDRCRKKIGWADWMICIVGPDPGYRLHSEKDTPFVHWEFKVARNAMHDLLTPEVLLYLRRDLASRDTAQWAAIPEDHREFIETVSAPDEKPAVAYFEDASEFARRAVADLIELSGFKLRLRHEVYATGTPDSRAAGRQVRRLGLLLAAVFSIVGIGSAFAFFAGIEALGAGPTDPKFRWMTIASSLATVLSLLVSWVGSGEDRQ